MKVELCLSLPCSAIVTNCWGRLKRFPSFKSFFHFKDNCGYCFCMSSSRTSFRHRHVRKPTITWKVSWFVVWKILFSKEGKMNSVLSIDNADFQLRQEKHQIQHHYTIESYKGSFPLCKVRFPLVTKIRKKTTVSKLLALNFYNIYLCICWNNEALS